MTQKNNQIPEGWVETVLGDIGTVVTGKTPSKNNPEDWGYEVDFITPSDINSDQKYIKFVSRKLSKYGLERLEKMVLQPGSIIVTCIGSDMGKVVMNFNTSITNQQINSIKVSADHNNHFLYYLLKNSHNKLKNLAVGGSTMPILNKSTFESLKFYMPSLEKQKEIAGVLGCLDDKIELLWDQNKTLEALGQALFRKWFVEFNFPNEEGKPYQASGGEMTDSEVGPIPISWRVVSLSQTAKFLNGLALQKYPPNGDSDLPVIKIRELKSGITSQTNYCSNTVGSKYIVTSGDLLFSWSGSLEVDFWQYEDGVLNQHLFKVITNPYPQWFVYNWILIHLPEFRKIAGAKAVTMGHIQRHHLDDAIVVLPENDLLQNLNKIMHPIYEKLKSNKLQIQTLSKIRDILLPELMSGRVRCETYL